MSDSEGGGLTTGTCTVCGDSVIYALGLWIHWPDKSGIYDPGHVVILDVPPSRETADVERWLAS